MKSNLSVRLHQRLPLVVLQDDGDRVRSPGRGWPGTGLWCFLLSVGGEMGLPVPVWAQERGNDFWGMHPMWNMWGIWGLGMMLMMLVLWGLLIVGLVLGLRWLLSRGRESRSDTAREILRQRYARGEIDHEEFDAKQRHLG